MTKIKWHSKLVNLAIALTLVLSLAGIALLPVSAANGAVLGVTVSTEEEEYCCSTNFTVTARIANSGTAIAVNVTGSISWFGPGGVTKLSGPSPAWGFNITNGTYQDVTWDFHCDGPGSTTFTVKAKANGVAEALGQKTINQNSAELKVEILEPHEDDAFMECTTFNITFRVNNIGCSSASAIKARVDEDSFVEVVGDPIVEVGSIDAGSSSANFTVLMHCLKANPETWLHVELTRAWDDCEEDEMDLGGTSDLVKIIQYEELVPECDVDTNPTKVCHNVTFSASATGGVIPYTYFWDFDDGTNSTLQNPIKHYTASGNYVATVTVTDFWTNQKTCEVPIEVREALAIISCNATPNPTKVDHEVEFNVSYTGGVESYGYSWDFGDGVGTSNEQNPTYTYLKAGNYTYCVNVTDSLDNLETCCHNITVNPPLTVSCNVTPNPTKHGHEVEFTATPSGGVGNYTYSWDFGDGGSSALQNPTHTYSNLTGAPIVYPYCVNVTDELDNLATCCHNITVNPPLEVYCDATPLETKLCHNITFTGTMNGGVEPYNWIWSFGDGNSTAGTWPVDEPVVEYHYGAANNYTACFNVTDKLGNEDGCCVDVIVHPPLEVECEVEPEIVNVCHAVNFTAARTGGVPWCDYGEYSWFWDFGDGTNSTGQNVTHTYMCVGNYTATVTLSDCLEPVNTANCTANVTVIIEPPQLISPILNAQLTSKNVTFEWEDIGCCNYTLEVWQKEEGGQKVLLVETGKDNTWTGPIFNGEWRWHVTATACNVSVMSDTWFFRVDQPGPAVTVMSPNGGEVWQSGDSHAITWTAVPTDGVIDIYYSSDNGATWALVAAGEVNDGAYPWTVPVIDSAQCLVRVVITDAATGSAQDTSDGVFTITTDLTNPTVTVTSPNGGESYAGGSTQDITWTASDNVAVTSIDLYFSSNGGAEWAIIATGEANDGTYSWTVPGVESDQCLVKAEASDAAGNVGSDTSDAVFSITITEETPPSVTVKTPNGGESWAGGSRQSITWKASDYWPTGGFAASADSDLTIKIYYKYGGGAWRLIDDDEVNDGEYKWDVPEINDTQCLVRVDAVDAAGNVGSDTSDDEFAIITGVVVSIPDTAVSANSSVMVPININGVTDLAGFDIWLSYDNTVVNVTAVGDLDLSGVNHSIDNANGVTKINWYSGVGQSGDLACADVTMQAIGSAGDTSALDLDVKALVDSNGVDIPHAVEDGVFTILALMEGDATLDGHVTIADALFAIQHAVAIRTLNADQLKSGDTTDNGYPGNPVYVVTAADALHIAQWLVDPDQTLGVLGTPLWDAVKDADMAEPVA